MLNILKNKLKKFNKSVSPNHTLFYDKNNALYTNYTKEKNYNAIQNYHKMKEYNNVIHRQVSSKEWFGSVYSFNNSYIKGLVVLDSNLNKLLKSYCNMLLYKIKILFKRRRHNKSRYSANRLYVSRAELKHTTTKLIILFYTYNKQKSFLERSLRKIITLIRVYKLKKEKVTELTLAHLTSAYRNSILKIFKEYTVYKNKNFRKGGAIKGGVTFTFTFTNRLIHLIKDNFLISKK